MPTPGDVPATSSDIKGLEAVRASEKSSISPEDVVTDLPAVKMRKLSFEAKTDHSAMHSLHGEQVRKLTLNLTFLIPTFFANPIRQPKEGRLESSSFLQGSMT